MHIRVFFNLLKTYCLVKYSKQNSLDKQVVNLFDFKNSNILNWLSFNVCLKSKERSPGQKFFRCLDFWLEIIHTITRKFISWIHFQSVIKTRQCYGCAKSYTINTMTKVSNILSNISLLCIIVLAVRFNLPVSLISLNYGCEFDET